MKLKELLAKLVEIDSWDKDFIVVKDGCCGAVCGRVEHVAYNEPMGLVYLLSDKDAIGVAVDPWAKEVV